MLRAHRAFVDAGAQLLLAGTFRVLPGDTPGWEALVEAAVGLAQAAANGRAEVWASIGPGGRGGAYTRLADRARGAGVDGLVLETFVDPEHARDALVEVRRAAPDVPVAVTLCPRAGGTLWSGAPPLPALRALLAAGADIVGFNCGEGPASVEDAVRACESLGPLWAKPNAGVLGPDALAAALQRLEERCGWVGGCCGVGPEVLARA